VILAHLVQPILLRIGQNLRVVDQAKAKAKARDQAGTRKQRRERLVTILVMMKAIAAFGAFERVI